MLWSHQAARAKTLPFRLAYHFVMPFGRSLIPKERSALLIMSSRPAIIATHLLWARHSSRADRRECAAQYCHGLSGGRVAAFEHSEGRGTPDESITCDHDQQAGPGPRPLHGVFARIEPARRGTTLWSSDSKGIVCHTISPQNELELACRAARESLR